MLKLFVTGGAGFIGSAFIRLALDELPACRITNFDALTYAGNLDNLEGIDESRHHFVCGDIADKKAVREALSSDDFDAVINFAAETHVDRSIESADEFLRTNVFGTQVLLDTTRELDAQRIASNKNKIRFIQISTDEVLGSLTESDDAFFNDDSPIAPNNAYAASKAAAEHLARAARRTFGLDFVITRCGNNYGARQFPEKLIPLIIANALEDKLVPVYGDGLNVRDWIHVDDHCRAILKVLRHGEAGAIYNIGARTTLTNIEVVKSILDLLDKPRTLIQYVKDRPGHDRRYAINPDKIERELDWRPVETWASGLRKTIAWYTTNTVWLKRATSGAYREFYKRQYEQKASG
ncbi:MAG: dTDP-glucose 4,6-dehydratase [Pyrinomonadaceae bacterium]